ncbi:MAG: mechanosensitive ion channel family protein [Porphyromonadaceae bacterium]|jgi:MscS family membrane protein|nr:mechanosensitive ion channel family protein [Porphyromonadaceae bacterium]
MFQNNSTQDLLISLGIIIIALIVNWIITILNTRYLRALAKRTKNQFDNILVNSLETPLKVGVVLFAIWTAFQRLEMSESFDATLFKIYEILTVLNITWFVAHLINGLLNEYFIKKSERDTYYRHRFSLDSHFISLIKKVVTFLIWLIGIVTALNNIGLDLKAILGTLGIGGIAIALAAQDTVKNVFGGFTILLDGTFRIGDRIIIGEHEGYVEDIGVRSTKIRNFDKRLITMPNYKIVEDAVINVSAAPQVRIINNLGIVYDTDPEKMQKALVILEEIAKSNENVSKQGISTAFEEFGDFALIIRFVYFIQNPSDRYETSSAINLEILKQFNNEGIEFAYPTQTIIFDGNEEVKS